MPGNGVRSLLFPMRFALLDSARLQSSASNPPRSSPASKNGDCEDRVKLEENDKKGF